ncbi:MAG: hypothetical protein HYS26_04320 [Candidatus Kaiserbacteria bacterium]|nr:MAG: hypothetical protein HYS26_04320 [Candidatus Kaiserbacteria bacterium]
MRKRTEIQVFDETASELEEVLLSERAGANIVFDSEMFSSCLTKMSTLRNGFKPTRNESGINLFDEISGAIKPLYTGSAPWSDELRRTLFDAHIGTIDEFMEGSVPDKDKLREAAMFLRCLITGVDNFKKKLLYPKG